RDVAVVVDPELVVRPAVEPQPSGERDGQIDSSSRSVVVAGQRVAAIARCSTEATEQRCLCHRRGGEDSDQEQKRTEVPAHDYLTHSEAACYHTRGNENRSDVNEKA